MRFLLSSVSPSRRWWPTRVTVWLAIAATGMAAPMPLDAVTLNQLVDNPQINAKKFANYFGDFAFEFSAAVQPPEVFLSRERGDCDDYAVLADFVLSKHGFGTRLIHVRLAGRVAHAVCYVTENKAYLDYNNRRVLLTLARSSPDLHEIATKVARSLQANWTTASEFTYSYVTRRKIMTTTISQTGGVVPNPGQPNSPFHVE